MADAAQATDISLALVDLAAYPAPASIVISLSDTVDCLWLATLNGIVQLSELLEKNRTVRLSEAEQAELDEFLRMNRFMSRLRLKARLRLSE